MKKLGTSLMLIILLVLSIFITVNAQPVIPPPTGYFFNDFAGVTSSEVRSKIENTAQELQQKTGAQIIVVIPDSLEDMAIDDYAYELFKEWKIGQKDKDNGVLLVVAPNERKSRIEVGKGLEGRLPDGKTGRIQDEHLLPFVKESNYDVGIINTFIALANEVAAEYDVTLTGIQGNELEGYRNNSSSKGSKIVIIILAALVILDLIFNRGSITGFVIEMLLWNALLGGRRGGSSGGFGGGGFYGGGGSSGGGGSDRDW